MCDYKRAEPSYNKPLIIYNKGLVKLQKFGFELYSQHLYTLQNKLSGYQDFSPKASSIHPEDIPFDITTCLPGTTPLSLSCCITRS